MTTVEKAGLYLAVLFIAALLCLIAFSENGIFDYRTITQKEQGALDQIRMVELENQKLENEIDILKTDMEYLKHLAKHEHDMIEEDELMFKDKPDNKGNTP
jgi:cell division protein FtsB